jgi:short-subunit dehydrogenase
VAPFGVNVSALCPGPTESEFFAVSRVDQDPGALAMGNRFRQSAEEVARAGLEGLACGKRTVIPYFGGKMTALAVRFLPASFITAFVARSLRPKK